MIVRRVHRNHLRLGGILLLSMYLSVLIIVNTHYAANHAERSANFKPFGDSRHLLS
jgi:hypothetical protein